MKVRSKKLWQYLADCNLLEASEEEIKLAKVKYRRLYKRQWKRNRIVPQKEIRPIFTLREYMDLKVKAETIGMNPTKYLKTIAVNSLDNKIIVPDKELLFNVMQLLTIASTTKSPSSINDAEKLLLDYLKHH